MEYSVRLVNTFVNVSLDGFNDKLHVLIDAVTEKMRTLTEARLGRPYGGYNDRSGPFFLPIFGPPGLPGGSGRRGNGPGSKNSASSQTSDPEKNYKSHSWVLCVFGTHRDKIKR